MVVEAQKEKGITDLLPLYDGRGPTQQTSGGTSSIDPTTTTDPIISSPRSTEHGLSILFSSSMRQQLLISTPADSPESGSAGASTALAITQAAANTFRLPTKKRSTTRQQLKRALLSSLFPEQFSRLAIQSQEAPDLSHAASSTTSKEKKEAALKAEESEKPTTI